MDTVRRRQLGVADGQLSVLEAGAGPPAVLLHGVPSGAELWREVLVRLAHTGFRALAPDLPGYGATRLRASADHSLIGSADLVASWLHDSGHAPAWIVGHDTGGAVGQLVATRAPGIAARLSLTSSIAHGCWPALRARVSTLAARAGLYRPAARLGVVPNPYMRREIRRAFADPQGAAGIDQDRVFWDAKVTDPEGRAAFQRHLAALSPHDTAGLPAALSTLAIPVDLVWGLADRFQSWEHVGRRLQASLPAARVTLLRDCGHFTPLECPERLCSALLGEPA